MAGKKRSKNKSLVDIRAWLSRQFHAWKRDYDENIAPLNGWLSSFFEKDSVIQILSCNAAADSTQRVGKYNFGQANDPNARGISHRGYELLLKLARASGQRVEGALHGQEKVKLSSR